MTEIGKVSQGAHRRDVHRKNVHRRGCNSRCGMRGGWVWVWVCPWLRSNGMRNGIVGMEDAGIRGGGPMLEAAFASMGRPADAWVIIGDVGMHKGAVCCCVSRLGKGGG